MGDTNTRIFSIDAKTDEKTGRPFGEAYKGEFRVRRPTLLDKREIALREAGALGGMSPANLDVHTVNVAYIMAHLDVLCEKRPEWCDLSRLWEEDLPALYAAWKEVQEFLASFRRPE